MSLLEFQNTKLIWAEGLLTIAIGFGFVASFATSDVSFFDDYVLLVMSWCHPDNQDAFCQDFREKHGLEDTEQLKIGDKYWERLQSQTIEIFFLLFGVRLGIAFFLQVAHVRKVRPTSIFMAVIWGASAVTIFTFGFVDFFYYVFQQEEIPDTLGWLDNAGVFQESKTWFGTIEHVEKEDLFATNIIGIGIIFLLILLEIGLYKTLGYKHRGIA